MHARRFGLGTLLLLLSVAASLPFESAPGLRGRLWELAPFVSGGVGVLDDMMRLAGDAGLQQIQVRAEGSRSRRGVAVWKVYEKRQR